MYQYKDITSVHLEPTEKCNAACPMCPRNIHGGIQNPFIINAELSLEDWNQDDVQIIGSIVLHEG